MNREHTKMLRDAFLNMRESDWRELLDKANADYQRFKGNNVAARDKAVRMKIFCETAITVLKERGQGGT